MTKIRNSKSDFMFEYWNLRFVCYLVLEISYFAMLYQSSRVLHERKLIEAPSGGNSASYRMVIPKKVNPKFAIRKTPINFARRLLLRAGPFPLRSADLAGPRSSRRWQPELLMFQPLLVYLGKNTQFSRKSWPHTVLREYPSPQVLSMWS